MIATMRLCLALLVALIVTPPLGLYQTLAVRTGWLDSRPVPRVWHRMVAKLLGLQVRVHGAPATQRPLLIAANHISWSDIVVLSTLADVHFIAKAEMAEWPVFGTLARWQRSVFVQRDARRDSGRQASEIAARLADGDPMVLFAEGTTSDGNGMLPFKTTLFAAAQMALEASGSEAISIQPVAIAYTRIHGMPMGRLHRPHAAWIGDEDLLPHLGRRLREGALDVEVRFGEPVEFHAGHNRKEAAREVERRVREMFAAILRNPL